MRKGILISGLTAAFAFAILVVSAAAPANFAGTWALDKAKSQGLSPRLQNADSVIWTITQNDKQISIESKVTGGQPAAGAGQPPAGTGGGAGGGRGMGGGMAGPQTYNLDGSEITADVGGGQMTGKSAMKAIWTGNTLELSRKITFTTADGERTSSSTQKLSVSGDNKVLTVNQHSEGGRGGPQDSTLVFNKQ
jgi:hypothetical protein